MKRDSLIAASAGALGGLLLVAAWRRSFFGMLLGLLFSPMPLAMTAFGLGLPALPVAVVSGAVAVAVVTGSVVLGAVYLAFDAAPVAILARIGLAAAEQAATAAPETVLPITGRAIGVPVVGVALAATALMLTALAMFPAGPDGLQAGLAARLGHLVDQSGLLRDLPETSRAELMKTIVRVLPGAAAWNWSVRAVISAALGQLLLARNGVARWPTPAYRTLAVPGWYVMVFWLATVVGWVTPGDVGFIVANAAVVMSLPLVLQGLAVVHCAAARFGLGRAALVVFYAVMLLASGPALVLIVALGVMEHFSNLRLRMAAQNGGK